MWYRTAWFSFCCSQMQAIAKCCKRKIWNPWTKLNSDRDLYTHWRESLAFSKKFIFCFSFRLFYNTVQLNSTTASSRIKDTEIKIVKQITDIGNSYQTLDQCFWWLAAVLIHRPLFLLQQVMGRANVILTTSQNDDGKSSLFSPYLRFLLGSDLYWLW